MSYCSNICSLNSKLGSLNIALRHQTFLNSRVFLESKRIKNSWNKWNQNLFFIVLAWARRRSEKISPSHGKSFELFPSSSKFHFLRSFIILIQINSWYMASEILLTSRFFELKAFLFFSIRVRFLSSFKAPNDWLIS